jgi:hypothetical protein
VQDPGRYSDNSGSLRVTLAPAVAGEDPGTPQPIPAETVQVDSRSSDAVQTDRVYPQGTRLRLTASGAYLMRQDTRWIVADAECTIASDDLTWRSSRHEGMFDGRKQPLGDVVVNGRIDTWVPRGGSGSCTGGDLEADHEYTFDLTTDRNGPLSLVVADDDHADNRGIVSVRVEVR